MTMDDRAVLVGGPFNDQCVGGDVTDILVIEMTDDEGIVHLYSLIPEMAECSLYGYVGIKAESS